MSRGCLFASCPSGHLGHLAVLTFLAQGQKAQEWGWPLFVLCPAQRGQHPSQHLGCGLEDPFGILRAGYLLTFAKGEGEPWGRDSWVWPVWVRAWLCGPLSREVTPALGFWAIATLEEPFV